MVTLLDYSLIDEKSSLKLGSHLSNYPAALSLPSQTIVNAKLEMTNPTDHDEIEADNAANDIINGGIISRKISDGDCSSGVRVSTAMENQLSHMQGGGQTMPHGLQSMMESGFGRDFSQVRLHTDSQAEEMSSSINAKAFTLGNDIYFNRGQFSPNTTEGQRLVAHELTHVVQGNRKISRADYDGPSIGPAPENTSNKDSSNDDFTFKDFIDCLIQLKNLVNVVITHKEARSIINNLLDTTAKTLQNSTLTYDFVIASKESINAQKMARAGMGAHRAVSALMKGVDISIWLYACTCDIMRAIENRSKSNVELIYFIIRALATIADCPLAPWPPHVKAALLSFNTASGIGDLYVELTKPYKRAEMVGNFYGGPDTIAGKVGFLAGCIPLVSDLGNFLGESAAKAVLAITED